MRRAAVALLALLLILETGAARAGAWPREKGAAFVSVSTNVTTGARTFIAATQDIRSYTSLFAEYGLTEKLTIGFDGGRAGGSSDPASEWLFFLRHPVLATGGGHRFAASIGFGGLHDPDLGGQARLRPGLSWGKGFESRWGGGWLGLETSADYRFRNEDFGFKADFTAGIRPSERWMLIFQVQTGKYGEDDPIVRLAPSVVRSFGERLHVQLGAIASVAGDDAMGVKFGTWFEF